MKRLFALALLTAAGTAACGGGKEKAVYVQTAPVTRRTIIIDAEATGAVEPINVVEVKSKASGMITRMPVETGTQVKPGDLLVQIDTRDVQNQYNQTDADLKAAQAKLTVAEAQKKRSDELLKARVITSQEYEASSLDYENAKAAIIRAAANVDLAKQRLEDATVNAPVSGTILEKSVSLGQVITSATSSPSGGTTLVKMADLGRVRVRALFNETDIGQVRPGQGATVTVDAYPDRRFQGAVEKIEPQAVIQQNVTMFPVLVTLENREGLLKPGMNGEVSVLVDQITDVLAVPNDAIKSVREAGATGALLGLNSDSVTAEVRAQMANMGGRGRREGADIRQQGEERQQDGRQQIEVTDAQCAAVTAAFRKKPAAQKALDDLRTKVRSGEIDFTAMRDQSQKIYADLGLDPRVAGACRRREMQANGAGGGAGMGTGGAGAPAGGATNGARPARGASAGDQSGRTGAATRTRGDTMQLAAPETGAPTRRTRPGLVFVADSAKKTYHPRIVLLGSGNFDYTEVVSGLAEGESVALLTSLGLQAQRQQQNDRIRQGMGMPGLTPSSGGQRGGATGGAAGARGR